MSNPTKSLPKNLDLIEKLLPPRITKRGGSRPRFMAAKKDNRRVFKYFLMQFSNRQTEN